MSSGAPVFGAADIDAMLSDWGQRIVINGVAHDCLLDERRREALSRPGGGGGHAQLDVVATVKQAHYPDVAQGAHVLLGPEGAEIEYTVFELHPSPQNDAGLVELLLRRT